MSSTIKAQFCSARCGAGKTSSILRTLATEPARYLYAVDRREVAPGRELQILEEARMAGMREPIIEIVFSNSSNGGGSKGIAALIGEAIKRCDPLRHAIIIVSHAGLKMTDHTTLSRKRWSLIIDETPDLFELTSMDTGPMFVPFFEANYEMQEDGRIDVKRPVSASEFDRPSLRPLRQFHDLVKRGGARASVTSWEETAEPWWVSRCWDASLLGLFDSVVFFADSFPETITYHHLKHEGVEFEEIFLADHRVWRDRKVRIYYYADDHEASAGRFRDAAMRAELTKIAAHMSSLGINNHLWTTNASIAPIFAPHAIAGDNVTPKQAGSNAWQHWHDASMIYAARPTPDEILIHGQRGMTEADLVRARGGYDIKQFCMRLSLRNPDSVEPVTIRLYDKEQAEELKSYLDEAYGFNCEVEHIDLDIKKPARARGRPRKQTEEERRVAKAIAQRKWKQARKAA
jgi:hypothetical protein